MSMQCSIDRSHYQTAGFFLEKEERCFSWGLDSFDLSCAAQEDNVTRVISIWSNQTFFGQSTCHEDTDGPCCPRSTDQCTRLVVDSHQDHWADLSACNGLQECNSIPVERIEVQDLYPCSGGYTDYETVTFDCVLPPTPPPTSE